MSRRERCTNTVHTPRSYIQPWSKQSSEFLRRERSPNPCDIPIKYLYGPVEHHRERWFLLTVRDLRDLRELIQNPWNPFKAPENPTEDSWNISFLPVEFRASQGPSVCRVPIGEYKQVTRFHSYRTFAENPVNIHVCSS